MVNTFIYSYFYCLYSFFLTLTQKKREKGSETTISITEMIVKKTAHKAGSSVTFTVVVHPCLYIHDTKVRVDQSRLEEEKWKGRELELVEYIMSWGQGRKERGIERTTIHGNSYESQRNDVMSGKWIRNRTVFSASIPSPNRNEIHFLLISFFSISLLPVPKRPK